MAQAVDMRQIKNLPEVLLNLTETLKNLSGNGVLKYWGEVNTYADLPSAPQEGAIYKVLEENEEHHIGAGDRVVFFAGEWTLFGYSSAGGGSSTVVTPEDTVNYMTGAEVDAAFK